MEHSMSRFAFTLLILSSFAVAAALTTAAPATGQTEAEIGSLEVRRDEIADELASIDADLGTTENELSSLDTKLTNARVTIELIADDFERAVDDRREPAATRAEMAIVGFTNGDPRQNALVTEVLALQGSDEMCGPESSTRRRSMTPSGDSRPPTSTCDGSPTISRTPELSSMSSWPRRSRPNLGGLSLGSDGRTRGRTGGDNRSHRPASFTGEHRRTHRADDLRRSESTGPCHQDRQCSNGATPGRDQRRRHRLRRGGRGRLDPICGGVSLDDASGGWTGPIDAHG